MRSAVLLIHSAGPQGPGEGSAPFATRLREELGSGYEVLFPIMPSLEDPHYETWSVRLDQLLSELNEPVIVLGHSLGGSVVLKHIAESGRQEPIAGLLLVATPFWGQSDWEAEWALPQDWPSADTALPRTFLFHSRDDEETPFAHLELYARRLPNAEVHPLDGNGHLFDRGDLSGIVATIRSLPTG
ncbi:MAG TPA: alpha/beta fold hydrolase [Solirubrobacterales bacterium]|nr:alpha/beta fold hydrolase [Solirubrobacterales bacterium]